MTALPGLGEGEQGAVLENKSCCNEQKKKREREKHPTWVVQGGCWLEERGMDFPEEADKTKPEEELSV